MSVPSADTALDRTSITSWKKGHWCPLTFRPWYHDVRLRSRCMSTPWDRNTHTCMRAQKRLKLTHTHAHTHCSTAVKAGQKLFNASGENLDSVILTTEDIWHSVHKISDPLCFCPEGMMLTHPPTTHTDSSQVKEHKVVYNLIWH